MLFGVLQQSSTSAREEGKQRALHFRVNAIRVLAVLCLFANG